MKNKKVDNYLKKLKDESIFAMDSINTGKNKPFDPSIYKNESDENKEENRTILIDFDGVLHKHSKGYYDGTIYDLPIDNAKNAIDLLKRKGFEIVIFSARISPSTNGKESALKQLNSMKDWLKKYDIYYDKITYEKIPADFYIDDNAIRFINWKKALHDVYKLNLEKH